MNGFGEVALSRLFRSKCSVCGSARLTWGSVGDEVARLRGAGQDPNDWLEQFFGEVCPTCRREWQEVARTA